MKILKTVFNNFDKWIVQGSFAVILVVMFVQTLRRFTTGQSRVWAEDTSSLILVMLTYLSASYAMTSDSHMRIDSAMMVYPRFLRKYVSILGNIVWMAMVALVTWYGFTYFKNVYDRHMVSSTVAWLPLWPFYLSIAVGHLLIVIRLVISTVEKIIAIARGEAVDEDIVITTTEVVEEEVGKE